MNEVSQKMPLLEKISYGAGNMGICLSTTVITTFAMFFYTNVIGINILQVGTILLFGGIVDAISNAFMGVIVDHTKSRWGKCRPYLIFGAIPMAAACFFVFHVPDASASTKYIYALITYIIYTLASAAVLIPQNVLMAAITDDQDDRLATNMFGSLGTNFGQLIPSLMTLGLVAFLGNGSDYKGFNYVILIFGVIGAALTMMAGFNTRERMNMSAIGQQKISAKDTLRSFKNGPWILVTLITLFIIAQVVVKASTTVYYTTNVLGNPGVSSALLSILSIIGVPITLIIPIIAKKIGKHKLVLMGAAMGIIGNMGLLFTKGSIPGVIACTAFAAAGSAFITGIVFVMCAETVDYGEWKTGIRVQGFLMAFIGFAVKVANSIVQLLISGILNSGGFNGQAKVQTVSAVNAIEFCYVWLPIIFFAAVIILNYFYKLDSMYPTPLVNFMEHSFVGTIALDQRTTLSKELMAYNLEVIKALNICNGVTHLECFKDLEEDSQICFCEIALRPAGSAIPENLKLQTNVDIIDGFAAVEIGEKYVPDCKFIDGIMGSLQIPINYSGKVVSIEHSNILALESNIVKADYFVEVGQVVQKADASHKRIGDIYVHADNLEEMKLSLKNIHSNVDQFVKVEGLDLYES